MMTLCYFITLVYIIYLIEADPDMLRAEEQSVVWKFPANCF